MKRADRPIIMDALRAQLPPGWTVRESGTVIFVRGPACPEDPHRNQWAIGTGAAVHIYPGGRNVISRFEPNVGQTAGFSAQHVSLYRQRGYRDLLVSEMIRIIANPPLTPYQRAATKGAA